MAETARIKISSVVTGETDSAAGLPRRDASIRVAPNDYFAAIFFITFFSGFLIYTENDLPGLALIAFGWFGLPLLLWHDRVVFDGATLKRTGLIPQLWARLNRQSHELKIGSVEQIETQAMRALKRGGSVFYRYRTSVQGNNLRFDFASGGDDYRRMVRHLFTAVAVDTLDNRSIELRDYLNEPKETLMKAEFAKLPSSDVLEDSINEYQINNRRIAGENKKLSAEEIEKSDYLRQLANELRLSGNLLQALEAFRRALVINPGDAWLIYDFGRCLYSFAGSERDKKLEKKALAALRLAEIRGKRDGELLARLGESYFQYGDSERARIAFQKALTRAGESFRSVRGLAEIALREGKLAHVIHHFATAIHLADTNALKNWARSETEYFSRLNNDDDYMDLEIRRINWLENIMRGKKTALRIAMASFFVIITGLLTDDVIANAGWAGAAVSLMIWAGMIMSGNMLMARSPIVEFGD